MWVNLRNGGSKTNTSMLQLCTTSKTWKILVKLMEQRALLLLNIIMYTVYNIIVC